MAGDDMLTVSYRVLRYIDECQRAGVEPTEGGAESASCVNPAYFATVVRALSEAGYVSGASVADYIDGTSAVTLSSARMTLAGAEYLSTSPAMARAAKLAGPAFETAVAALVAAAARAVGLG